jgi:hypothetical protein
MPRRPRRRPTLPASYRFPRSDPARRRARTLIPKEPMLVGPYRRGSVLPAVRLGFVPAGLAILLSELGTAHLHP